MLHDFFLTIISTCLWCPIFNSIFRNLDLIQIIHLNCEEYKLLKTITILLLHNIIQRILRNRLSRITSLLIFPLRLFLIEVCFAKGKVMK